MNRYIETDRLFLREFIVTEVHTYLGNNPVINIEESQTYIEDIHCSIRQTVLEDGQL